MEEEEEEEAREGVTIFGDNATQGIHNYCCCRHFREEGSPKTLRRWPDKVTSEASIDIF